jgi:3-dehydroquinate synthase
VRRIVPEGAAGPSLIAVGEPLSRLGAYCNAPGAVIITDATVRRLHGVRFPAWEVIEIGMGEESKTLTTVGDIYNALLRLGVDRSSQVVAIGGGIVCDVAGFAASTYLRGLRFGFVPTTLLAQVDASVGGKNGVNLHGYKNLVGTFTQPDFVLCDLDLLGTLPEGELQNGFAEVIKQAAIGDASLFSFLETHSQEALRLDRGVIERIIYDSLKIKAAIVSRDERESGIRRKLNFGHTLGHAVEKVHHTSHGRAVSLGMRAASRLSAAMGLLSQVDLERIERLLAAFGLPLSMEIDGSLVWEAFWKDKKREGKEIHFVLLEGIGNAVVVPISIDALKGVIDDLCQHR